jgi:1,4-alpha-glucan branching enzyme
MKTGASVEYAVRRFKTHVHWFDRIAKMVEHNWYDEGYLREVTAWDRLFPDIDYRMFQTRPW